MRFIGSRLTVLVAVVCLSRAAAAIEAPSYNWTAAYGGATAGFNWGSADTTYLAPGLLNGFFPADQGLISAQGSGGLKPHGFAGGVEVGYNWQWGNIVSGVEGDFQYLGFRKSFDGTFGTVFAGTQGTHTDVNVDWLFTFRGRVGLALNRTLLYATGGLAVADVRFAQSNFFPAFATIDALSVNKTKAGWVIGGGIEQALWDKWSIKVEYLHIDLGNINEESITNGFLNPAVQVAFSHNTDVKDNIVRAGFNYRF